MLRVVTLFRKVLALPCLFFAAAGTILYRG